MFPFVLFLRGKISLALLGLIFLDYKIYTRILLRHAQAVLPAPLGTSGHPTLTSVLLLAQRQECSQARGHIGSGQKNKYMI